MIKITFEVDENFVKNRGNMPENKESLLGQNPTDFLLSLFGICACRQLEKKIQEGQTEFVVTPSALTDMGQKLYDRVIDEVCACATEIREDNDNKEVED